MIIKIFNHTGSFAENKDIASNLKNTLIKPQFTNKDIIILDFGSVELTTQSFIHALISEILREHGEAALDSIEFKNCNKIIRGIIETVVQYSLDSLDI